MKNQTTHLFAIALLHTVCLACGSSNESSSDFDRDVPAARNPDAMAWADMRNDCMQNQWRLLGANVAAGSGWYGPLSTYRLVPQDMPNAGAVAWSPLEAKTHPASAIAGEGTQTFLRLSGDATLPAACDLLKTFFAAFEGAIGTDTYIQHEWILTHRFPSFVFPTDASQIPTSTAAIAATPESTFLIESKRPFLRGDGTYDYQTFEILGTREWKLEDVTCEQGFTVQPVWGDIQSQTPFCKDTLSGKPECLGYQVQYSADRCRFKIRNQTFPLRDGRSFAASLGGYFAKSDSGGGYKLAFTNVEF